MLARSRPFALSLLLITTLSWNSPAEAATDRWDAVRADALERLDVAQRLLTTRSLLEAVSTVAELGGLHADAMPVSPAVGLRLPEAVAAPVAMLVGAVRQAETIAGASVRMSESEFLWAQAESERVLEAWTANPGSEPAGLDELRRFVSARVDTAGLASAAATIARVIDWALPRLRAAAASMGPSETRVVGCEVGEVPGVLCVGGTGANTYERDYALVIDLGGDDVHANSAGGADPLVNGLAVAVTLDVGGNDTYRVPPTATSEVAQGAGIYGGVGFLVDGGGNDVYEFEPSKPNGRAYGQGLGAAAAGILADLGGSDRYSIVNTGPGIQEVNGLAAAGLGGLALALDTAGNDSYTLASRPTPLPGAQGVELGEAEAGGVGTGDVGGVAAFVDSGGTDTIIVEAIVSASPRGQEQAATRSSSVLAIGHGGAGTGVALAGPGDSTWSALSENHSAPSSDFGGSAFVGGTGQGALGGFGALYDAGGNDIYRSEAMTHVVRERSIDDSCSCSRVDTVAKAGFANVLATGYGAAGGVGILSDAAGNDRYIDSASSFAEAIAHDGRASVPADGAVSARAEAATSDALLYAQGASIIGFAFLLDGSGDDVYEATVLSEARAIATAADPDAVTEGVANAGAAEGLFAQGAGVLGGYGELTDTGGTDRYRGVATSTVLAQPATGGAPGLTASSVQGSVDLGGIARLSDIDGGAADSFAATPPDTACAGTRGQGVWGDCGIGVGIGVNT